VPRLSAAGAWMLCLALKCWHFFLSKLKAKLAFAPTAPKALDCVDGLVIKKANICCRPFIQDSKIIIQRTLRTPKNHLSKRGSRII
jgi:hypothetical protein